jgi:hypothetical protein
VRAEAIRRGITVFVPTPRLKGEFKKLDPQKIPRAKINEAAGPSRGAGRAEDVALVDLPAMGAIVCGSVAVNFRRGHHISWRRPSGLYCSRMVGVRTATEFWIRRLSGITTLRPLNNPSLR